jgi:hypothetical protein
MPEQDKYSKLINDILNKVKTNHNNLNEARISYDDKHSERMAPELELALRRRKHSLGEHPAFPEGDEQNFEEKIMGERFKDVVKNAKKYFDTESIDPNMIKLTQLPLLKDCMVTERSNRKELEELAIKMIREEFDIPEEDVEITAELVDSISLEGTKKNPKPIPVEGMEFNTHKDLVNANKEVYKRRLLNAMIQGAAKKNHHMFHMVDDELSDMNPRLPNLYSKTMAAADYMYYIIDKMETGIPGGVVRVEFPKAEGDKPKIHAQALIFPVLIHELAKGAMELLSSHGLPEDEQVQKYVIGKADFLAAEPWDMRLGPALWERFTKLIDPEDFNLKHHVYMELASLPVDEFNDKMKEIFAGTAQGKEIISGIVADVKKDMKQDDFNEAINSRRQTFEDTQYLDSDGISGINLEDFGL